VSDLLPICENLRRWFREKEYKGIDPYQLDEKVFSQGKALPFLRYLREALKPLHSFVPRLVFARFDPIHLPKALGLIMGGNCSLYRVRAKREYMDENYELLRILERIRSPGLEHTCWGWPFEWGQYPRYPKDLPLPCVTSPIAHALLDFYCITNDDKVLGVAEDVARFLMYENGFREFQDSLCLFYSCTDPNLVYSGNLMSSAFLARLSQINSGQAELDFAKKASRFVLNGQNGDGSWNYSYQKRGRRIEMIDNRHSGFVLESLSQISRTFKDERIEHALRKGWKYYRENFFEGSLPKWSPSQVFPVDIHDVAQAIITCTEMRDWKRAEQIMDFAIKKMSNKRDEFYYKYFENGRTNQIVFFRWAQAWMFKALSFFLEKKSSKADRDKVCRTKHS